MKKFILLLMMSGACLGMVFILSPLAQASFSDVHPTDEHYEGVSYLELVGAVDPAENFRPSDAVTRAEFFKILFKVSQEEPGQTTGKRFSDAPSKEWYTPYAELAADHGLASGGTFEPGKTMRRASTLRLVMQIYGLGAPLIPEAEREEKLFSDVSWSHSFYEFLAQAVDLGILSSNPEAAYRPYEKVTRGELAELIYHCEQWYTASRGVALAEEDESFYKSDIFSDIWNTIISDFYLKEGQEIDQDVLFQAAVKAVLESLKDPYSSYFTPEEATEFMSSLEGEFEGIGALLNQDEATMEIFITSFIEGSPAAESELKVGDQILQVDGVDTQDMLMNEVIQRILGPAGTEVTLTVERDGKNLEFTLLRERIELNLVNAEVWKQNRWYIRIQSFASDIVKEMEDTVSVLQLELEKPEAIVLDLRGNPGGYVNMANYIASFFMPEVTPVVTLDYGGHQESIYNGREGPYYGIPLYVLVDEYSASASEILALSLRETAGALIIGTPTFGKGTAQNVITYWDGSILKLTIAEWLSAEGNSVEGVGITPDIVVDTTNWDPETEEDPWLEAVEIVEANGI